MAKIKVEGLNELMNGLEKTVEKFPKITAAFLKGEGNILRKNVRKIAKKKIGVKTGNYMKGFDKTKPEISKANCAIKVFNDAPHSHLIEYGTVKRSTKKGANRGFMKGAFILEEAAKNFEGQFSKDIEDKLVDELLKAGAF